MTRQINIGVKDVWRLNLHRWLNRLVEKHLTGVVILFYARLSTHWVNGRKLSHN